MPVHSRPNLLNLSPRNGRGRALFIGSRNIISGLIAFITLPVASAAHILGFSLHAKIFIMVTGAIGAASPRIVLEWEKAVLLRLGKFNRVLEPGIVWIIPGINMISSIKERQLMLYIKNHETTSSS